MKGCILSVNVTDSGGKEQREMKVTLGMFFAASVFTGLFPALFGSLG